MDRSWVEDELGRKRKMGGKVRVGRTATRSKLEQEIAAGAPRSAPLMKSFAQGLREDRSPVTGTSPTSARGAGKFPIVVVAASTGGPATLMKFVPQFPRDFPGAVGLVQHMPGNFTSQFSHQLAEVSQIRVKEAEAGEILVPSHLYIFPGSHHMRVSPTGRVSPDAGPRINGYRPRAALTL